MTTSDHSQDSELARGEERASDADLPQEADAPREAARPTDEARPATEEHLANEERTRQAPAQHSAPSARRFGLPVRAWRIMGAIGLVLSVCGVGAAWAVSSPLGASPDDDYHLGSIW